MKLSPVLIALLLPCAAASGETPAAPKEAVLPAQPLGLKVSVKMVGPYMQAADLQAICLFKHKEKGDTYQGAAKDTDEHLSGLLSALRNRGDFVGELGETLVFSPARGSIPARRFMLIGLGEESELSLQSLKIAGRAAMREAVRLKAAHLAWAPVIRDQGNSTLDVGDGDRAFVEEAVAALDTELKLQAQGLAPKFKVESLVIEAGPSYFDSAAKKVGDGLEAAAKKMAARDAGPYASPRKK